MQVRQGVRHTAKHGDAAVKGVGTHSCAVQGMAETLQEAWAPSTAALLLRLLRDGRAYKSCVFDTGLMDCQFVAYPVDTWAASTQRSQLFSQQWEAASQSQSLAGGQASQVQTAELYCLTAYALRWPLAEASDELAGLLSVACPLAERMHQQMNLHQSQQAGLFSNPLPSFTAGCTCLVQLAPGQVRATLDATLSQSATFSLALPADETLKSQTLPGGARAGGNAGSPQRPDLITFNRRIHRYCAAVILCLH